jgi:hypothetical protein
MVQGSGKYNVKIFLSARGEIGLEKKIEKNSMIWPKNGLMRFLL